MFSVQIGPIFLSNFNCTGNETDLMDCPHKDRLSLGNCSTGHSASVVCYMDSGLFALAHKFMERLDILHHYFVHAPRDGVVQLG